MFNAPEEMKRMRKFSGTTKRRKEANRKTLIHLFALLLCLVRQYRVSNTVVLDFRMFACVRNIFGRRLHAEIWQRKGQHTGIRCT